MALVVKNPPAIAEDIRNMGSVPGLERSPGGGHGNPLQYSCLENPMDRGTWWATVHGVTTSHTRLKCFSTQIDFRAVKFGSGNRVSKQAQVGIRVNVFPSLRLVVMGVKCGRLTPCIHMVCLRETLPNSLSSGNYVRPHRGSDCISEQPSSRGALFK